MALLIDHQPVNLAPGTYPFGPVNVPDGAQTVSIRLARATTATPSFWPLASTRVNAQMQTSVDGEATWQDSCGFAAEGGVMLRGRPPSQTEIPETYVQCALPPGTGRRIRAVVIVSGGTLVSQLTIEVV